MQNERFPALRNFIRDRRGSAAAEYGIIVSFFACLALAVANTFSTELRAMAETVLQALAQVQ